MESLINIGISDYIYNVMRVEHVFSLHINITVLTKKKSSTAHNVSITYVYYQEENIYNLSIYYL